MAGLLSGVTILLTGYENGPRPMLRSWGHLIACILAQHGATMSLFSESNRAA